MDLENLLIKIFKSTFELNISYNTPLVRFTSNLFCFKQGIFGAIVSIPNTNLPMYYFIVVFILVTISV